jgi:hypothetical protein
MRAAQLGFRWSWSFARVFVALFSFALTACDTVGVKDAYTGLDGMGQRKRRAFYTDTEAIYCVLELASGVDDYAVEIRVRAHEIYSAVDGEPIRTESIIAREEQAPGRSPNLIVSFQLERPEGYEFYPAGKFTCEFYIDGKREAELDFEVRYPDCPFKPIEHESSCAGVVLRGTECPGAIGDTCVCDDDNGTWLCE